MSGAPKNSPTSAGATVTMNGSALCNGLSTLTTGLDAVAQSLAALQAVWKASFTCVRFTSDTASTIASTASRPTLMTASVRN